MAMVTASDSKAFSEVFERRAIGILSQTFDSVEHVHRLILRAPSLESLERVNLPGITALLGQLTNTIAICSRIRADGRRLALQEQRDSAPLQGIVNGVYPVGPQSAGD